MTEMTCIAVQDMRLRRKYFKVPKEVMVFISKALASK